ncbi:MAG TPA: N-acetyltransferase [Bryobacteraceae bacterium]|jgi:ribosomal protein S18 acetylase RimI-like enzyme|nr:N-acetyltransferase [Bryobacteraceae bacterium]
MIRSLTAADRQPILDLLCATGNFNSAELAIAAELIGIVIDQPGQADYYSWVAEITGDNTPVLAGFLVIGPVPATAGSWHMYWIAVHPSSYGSGIAASLQSYAEGFVRSRCGYWLLAETSGQPGYQRARAFYRKHGYQQLARVADYYKPSDDLILFGKRLAAQTPGDENESPLEARE